MSYGELGVRNFEQSTENLCVVENSNGTYEELNADAMAAYCGIDDSGIPICSTDQNWIQTMGNEIWDTGEEFTDCGCDTNGNPMCKGDDGWEDEFGNGIWDEEEFIDCADTFINHTACCEAGGCPIDEPDCHLNTSMTGFKAINNRYPGKDGVYSSRGGINPQIYSPFCFSKFVRLFDECPVYLKFIW